MKKSVIIIIGIIVICVSVVIWYFMFSSDDEVPILDESTGVTTTTTENTPDTQMIDDTISARDRLIELRPEFANDVDRDGLTAEQEAQYGTSDTEFDSDADGLSDVEEIERWKTDPTNPDTDGDSYADAFEIANGYNPNGSGMLPEEEQPTTSDEQLQQ